MPVSPIATKPTQSRPFASSTDLSIIGGPFADGKSIGAISPVARPQILASRAAVPNQRHCDRHIHASDGIPRR
jgi:hypothetical protein